jgi:vacuolar-type H+-ATPase subunit I/STV1
MVAKQEASAQFFFHPKFTRIAPPREGEKNYDEKARSSLVHEFNRVQKEQGRGTCGSTAASEWLQQHRPKVALHQSMTDYCDSCKHLKEQLSRNQAIMNRSQQSGNVTESELRALEEERGKLEEELAAHKEVATKSREYHNVSKEKRKRQWREIVELTKKTPKSRNDREELVRKQHCFTLIISADYQQSKLIPSWGKTEQPGSTYYLQKVSLSLSLSSSWYYF